MSTSEGREQRAEASTEARSQQWALTEMRWVTRAQPSPGVGLLLGPSARRDQKLLARLGRDSL